MSTVITARQHRSTLAPGRLRLGTALLSALALVGCSQGPGGQGPTGGSATGATSPPPASATATAPARENGDLVFSRAVTSATDGLPVEAVIRRLSDRGSVGRVLAEGASYRSAPSWSPEGRAFAYVGDHGIWVWRPAGSTLVASCHPSACSGSGPPAWSPSGSAIAFAGEREGLEGLFEVSAGGGQVRAIATDLTVRGAPAWSPDAASIAVIAVRGGSAGIEILDARSGQVQEQITLPALEVGEAIAWSPDGAMFAIEAEGSSAGGIYLVARDGSDPRLLSACPDDGCTDLAPAFSPDGRWLVFTRARCDEPGSDCFVGDVWVVAVDGGAAHAFTRGTDLDCCAAWGPLAL
jgi:Tol biopolymer transport system component